LTPEKECLLPILLLRPTPKHKFFEVIFFGVGLKHNHITGFHINLLQTKSLPGADF
jgi:hypothetical protein